MLDRLFFVALVLNATGLFRFVAPHANITIGEVSLVLLLVNVWYLLARARWLEAVLLHRVIGAWLVILILWPAFALLYAPSVEIRQIGLQLYYFTLFLGTVVYAVANPLTSVKRVLSASAVVTMVGLILSMVAPQYFETAAALADARVAPMGRPVGFFLQPNSLATGMVLLFIGWFWLWRRKNTLLEAAFLLIFLFLLLLTGSRAGVLMGLVVVMLTQVYLWKTQVDIGKIGITTGFLLICLVGGIIVTDYILVSVSEKTVREEHDIIGRIETMVSLRLTDAASLSDDTSVRERLEAQAVYWSLIQERPLLGHGFGSEEYFLKTGALFLSAHSNALTAAMEYGVLYPVAFLLMMFCLYANPNRRRVERSLRANGVGQFVVVTMFLFIVQGGLFDSRTFYVVWGIVFAAVHWPEFLFGRCMRDERLSKPTRLIVKGPSTLQDRISAATSVFPNTIGI
jgi:O-antigen ligase